MIDPADITDLSIKALLRLDDRPETGNTTDELKKNGIPVAVLETLVNVGWLEVAFCTVRNTAITNRTRRWRITESGRRVARSLTDHLRSIAARQSQLATHP